MSVQQVVVVGADGGLEVEEAVPLNRRIRAESVGVKG